jgi:hypothetical protein
MTKKTKQASAETADLSDPAVIARDDKVEEVRQQAMIARNALRRRDIHIREAHRLGAPWKTIGTAAGLTEVGAMKIGRRLDEADLAAGREPLAGRDWRCECGTTNTEERSCFRCGAWPPTPRRPTGPKPKETATP